MLETEITDKVKALTAKDWQELQGLYRRVTAHKGSSSISWAVVNICQAGR